MGKILRDTRITDMTYADDFIEWIGEGLNRMLIRWRLDPKHMVLEIKNHEAKLPCGLVTLNGVIYNGQRLRRGASEVDVRIKSWNSQTNVDSFFQLDPTVTPENVNDMDYRMVRGLNLQQITTVNQVDFYQLRYDYIKTSFKEGCIILLYRKMDTDKEGYPLVPDLQEARDALFWYVCSKLCFTGYRLPDPKMDFEYCDNKAELFFARAKKVIKAQSIDEKETAVQMLNNLIPPDNYYETFFQNAEQRKYVNK